MNIAAAKKSDQQLLLDIWESSVRATHDFLAEEDLIQLKPLIFEQYFNAVDLTCAKNNQGKILGFCGVHDGHIEMLFIAPEARGCGAGRLLVSHAIQQQGATAVDVNEQNQQARGFYEHVGFAVTGRSPVDGQGKPYPLLHMQLATTGKSGPFPKFSD